MRWTISFIAESNIIQVETEGETRPDSINQMVKELKEASDVYGSTLFLVDHRKLNYSLDFMEMHERPRAWQGLEVPRGYRIAEVVPEQYQEVFKHLETVSRNRGYDMWVFIDIESAKEWLKKK